MSNPTETPDMIVQSADQYIKDQALMEQMLEELQSLREQRDKYAKECDRLRTQSFKNAIRFQAEIKRRQTAEAFLDKFLDEQEGIHHEFDGLLSHQIGIDYCAAAKFRADHGRDNHSIEEIQQWCDSPGALPHKTPVITKRV